MVVRELWTALGFKVDESGAKKYEEVFNRIKGLAIKAAVAIGLADIGKQILENASAYEQEKIQLTALTGSAQKAQQVLAQIAETADKTVFNREELIDYTKQLLTFGYSVDEIGDLTTKFGNIAVVVGKDKVGGLVQAFARIRETGIADTRVFREFFSSGIDLQGQLAKQLGLTKIQMDEMIKTGRIGYKDLYSALTAMTTGEGQYANLNQRYSASLAGQWKRVQEVFQQILTTLGTYLLPVIKDVLSAFTGWLSLHKGDLAKGFIKFLSDVAYAIGFIVGIIEGILQKLGITKKPGPPSLGDPGDPTKVIPPMSYPPHPEGVIKGHPFVAFLDNLLGNGLVRGVEGWVYDRTHSGGGGGTTNNNVTVNLTPPAGSTGAQERWLQDAAERVFGVQLEKAVGRSSDHPSVTGVSAANK